MLEIVSQTQIHTKSGIALGLCTGINDHVSKVLVGYVFLWSSKFMYCNSLDPLRLIILSRSIA